jgi:UDP-N-acetylmuramyl pentapeptide phosphotransferase/UDP-N-acetylglucosamine-1-phosphate transferase
MNTYLIYGIILIILVALELLYFKIADHFNIIDKPNERSSHSSIVLRGGGVIFLLGVWLWCAFFGFHYPLFLAAVTLAAGVSFIDDVDSLPDSARLVAQFAAMGLMIWQLLLMPTGGVEVMGSVWAKVLFVVVALIVCVGATNIYNFMDGINGITAGYSLAVLVPLLIMNYHIGFVEPSFLVVMALAVLVFSFFNFRPRGKAKCFAGDVGSVGIAFIVLFAIGLLIVQTGDVTWLIFLLVYGVDGCLTICHRILLHENLGQAHRKHAYQIMANELKMSHPAVSLIYMAIQLIVSFGFIFLCPDTALAHWIYLALALVVLAAAYLLFMKKYYHLHAEYLESRKNQNPSV